MGITFEYAVYMSDVDLGNVVYFPNYLQFVDRAKTDLFLRLDLNEAELAASQEVGFMVRNVEIAYLKPLKYLDSFIIEFSNVTFKRTGMSIGFEFRKNENSCSTGRLDLVCVNSHTLRVTRVPEKVLSAFNGFTQ